MAPEELFSHLSPGVESLNGEFTVCLNSYTGVYILHLANKRVKNKIMKRKKKRVENK